MPETLTAKPLPLNHGNQIVEMFAVTRPTSDPEFVEFAEHKDGAAKMYGTRKAADAAAKLLGPGWTVETVWLLHKGWSDIPSHIIRENMVRKFEREGREYPLE